MNYYQLIKERESVRNYDTERPITDEVLSRILDAGRLAPSAANRQPWEFIMVSSKEMLEKIRPCYHREWFKEAPHVLIVKGFSDQSWVRADGYNALETDLTIAMDHMILSAEYEGVGTCWIAAFDPELLSSALELKKNEIVYAITPLGYQKAGFEKQGNKVRKSFEEVVRFV